MEVCLPFVGFQFACRCFSLPCQYLFAVYTLQTRRYPRVYVMGLDMQMCHLGSTKGPFLGSDPNSEHDMKTTYCCWYSWETPGDEIRQAQVPCESINTSIRFCQFCMGCVYTSSNSNEAVQISSTRQRKNVGDKSRFKRCVLFLAQTLQSLRQGLYLGNINYSLRQKVRFKRKWGFLCLGIEKFQRQ